MLSARATKAVVVTSQIARYRVDESTVVGFEVDAGPGFRNAGPKELLGQVRDAVGPAVEAAKVVLEKVKDVKPDGVEVKFGVKVTGEATWIVAKATGEGNFEITLTWAPSDGEPAATQ